MREACDHPRDALLIDLFWHTGARVSELVGARGPRKADLTATGLRLRNLKRGEGAEKHVLLHPVFLGELQQLMHAYPLTRPLVGRLDDGDRPIGRGMAWRIVSRAATKASVFKAHRVGDALRPAWCHTLRHGNAVHLLLNGVAITGVQRQLGHANLGNTQRYTQIADEDLARQIGRVPYP